jgi:P-type Cu+ transporter
MKKQVVINGMHCAGCVQSVEKAIKRVEGVEDAVVQLTTETATIQYNDKEPSIKEIKEAVQKAGYEVEDRGTESVTFEIGGMHCTGCSSAVEKAVSRLEGVITVNVNLTAEKAFVEYDSTRVDTDAIARSIENSGYEVVQKKKSKIS